MAIQLTHSVLGDQSRTLGELQMNSYRTTFSNQYYWATVQVAAETNGDARQRFMDAVTSKDWTDAADEERAMWVEENGEFDHDAYTYIFPNDAIVEVHEYDVSTSIESVELIDGGLNG